MSENWKIQVSPKLTDGTLINLRAETPEEAERILDWSIANVGKIGEAVKALNAVEVFVAAFPGSQVSVQPQAQAPAQPAQQGGWNTGAQTPPPAFVPQGGNQPGDNIGQQNCVHGAMTLRRAKPESGKSWVAYMCPTKQGTPGQCSPIDAKTGKAWG